MTITSALPGEVLDVRPLAGNLATSKSRTLLRTPQVEVIRIVLPAGKVLPEHRAFGEIIVQCLEGFIEFRAQGEQRDLRAGELLFLTAGEPHSLVARESSSILLTIVGPAQGASS